MITKDQLDEYIAKYNRGEDTGLSDEEYDNLLEEYLKKNGEDKRPFLRTQQTDDVNDAVGTLGKVYGVTKPMRPGQKTYVEWVNTKKINPKAKIIIQPKFDGCSVAYDCNSQRFFTRGDYDNGESVDVTELFIDYFDKSYDIDITAVKFEAIMAHEIFKDLGLNNRYKRPRDAVAGIITSRNVSLSKFITLVPLREYSSTKPKVSAELCNISITNAVVNDNDIIQEFIDNKLCDGAIVEFNELHYSIDGVVVSVINNDGEVSDNEIAIKILNNIKETRIINIDYQYGKTGKITPVGILEPVLFDNVIVDHVGLSTLDRVSSLGLKYYDTVRIVYNIVPYLLDSYHDGKYPIPLPDKYLDSDPIIFNGDILITDPCYIIREDKDGDWGICCYGYDMEKLGINHYMTRNTLCGDWGCTTYNLDTKEKIGEFCADAGLVSVFLLDEVLKYNPDYDWHITKQYTATVIKDFKGTVKFVVKYQDGYYENETEYHRKGEHWEEYYLEVIGHGSNKVTDKPINFVGKQGSF